MSEIETLFGEASRWLWSMVFVTDFGHRLHWFYFLCFFALACCVYIIRKPGSTSMLSFLLPKHVLLNRSTKTDVIIYLLNGVVGTTVNIATLIVSTTFVAESIFQLFNILFGQLSQQLTSGPLIKFIFGCAFLLLTDFSVFFAHYLHHKLPYLWSFHKTHHSAEVLTPVTAFRFHPVELMLTGLILSLFVGPLIGTYQYLFDEEYFSTTPKVFGYAMLLWLLTANFRHSHIPLHFPGFISRWLVSPVMHNIHHSTDPRHFDKNFGLLFSFWDRLAGTWFLPAKAEKLEFGLCDEKSFVTAMGCYLSPIRECYARLKRQLGDINRSKSS